MISGFSISVQIVSYPKQKALHQPKSLSGASGSVEWMYWATDSLGVIPKDGLSRFFRMTSATLSCRGPAVGILASE